MGACTAFIFAALLEFTLTNYLWRKGRKNHNHRRLMRAHALGNAHAQNVPESPPSHSENGGRGQLGAYAGALGDEEGEEEQVGVSMVGMALHQRGGGAGASCKTSELNGTDRNGPMRHHTEVVSYNYVELVVGTICSTKHVGG